MNTFDMLAIQEYKHNRLVAEKDYMQQLAENELFRVKFSGQMPEELRYIKIFKHDERHERYNGYIYKGDYWVTDNFKTLEQGYRIAPNKGFFLRSCSWIYTEYKIVIVESDEENKIYKLRMELV